jgi:anhydro-N-acetylmuramic acid kinase
MTGTSCDGLDVACAEFDGPSRELSWRPLWSATAPYPPELRRRVLDAQAPGYRCSTRDWLKLHRDLGRWYAQALARILSRHSPRPQVIANHGQTLAHFPDESLTLQLGDPTLISQATGLTVACSFREGDIAAGGQGAPLVPRFHAMLARGLGAPQRAIAIHNLGGISNLTYLGPGNKILAFDTGPANAWIDAAAARVSHGKLAMDRGGKLAKKGRPDLGAVRAVLAHPFFRKHAPKSTGRDDFPFEILLKLTDVRGPDLVATATAVTIASVAQAYEKEILKQGLPLDQIHFCGGGAKNPALIGGIRDWLGDRVEVHVLGQSGRGSAYDPQLIEAQAFAYAGCLSLLGSPIGGPWTGARGFGPPAHVIPGENWAEVTTRVHETRSRR